MKKILLAFSMLLFLQSCNIQSDVIYHSDKTASFKSTYNFEKFIQIMTDLEETNPNVTDTGKGMGEIDSIPTEWTSLYEISKRSNKGKKSTVEKEDYAEKIYMKREVKGDKTIGISTRFDRITPEEFNEFNERSQKNNQKDPMKINNTVGDWDGKKLVLSVGNYDLEDIQQLERIAKNKDTQNEINSNNEKSFSNAMVFKLKQTLHFEKPIKKIIGKHDWLKQIDNYTLQLSYSSKELKNEKKLKNKDKEIIIITQ